ncbi:DUF4296 domain-containing protein [Schleiferiaceae bacterium]|nr:DUF4296 domain-containing protein [Schleiferiaceae bacterium]
MKPLLLLGLLLTLGCSSPSSQEAVNPMEAPEDLLPEATFVRLLYEMNLLEGARTGNTLLGDSIPLSDYYLSLYQEFGVSPIQVQQSFAYYHGNAEQMAIYYQWIIDSLRADVQTLSVPRDEEDED